MSPGPASATSAAIAAHRFGLGEARLAPLAADPAGWLLAQIGPADAQRGDALADSATALARHAEYAQQRRAARQVPAAATPDGRATEEGFVAHFRALVQADTRARLLTAATTTRPFAERLALFWANHFTVSQAKASVRGLVGPFEREAIRPHTGGRFETMLGAAVRHPAMLRYLDNDRSAGTDSRVAQRLKRRGGEAARVAGLNENLAREVLELHTLGVGGGYTQADVTAFAAVLTGWRPEGFDPAWHQPGPKTVLGRVYTEGPDALDAVLRDLARHPATARFVATKLARHVVADEPPAALVDRLVAAWQRSDGNLAAVATALVQAPEAWTDAAHKLKTPEEFVLASARVLQLGASAFERNADGAVGTLGQRVHAAPSPAGWPDRAAEWLGPDAVWKRVEWAHRVGERLAGRIDARAVAVASLGPWLSDGTRREIERAADGAQALALLLLAPEFQRR
ncbi:MAG: DUF1800 domain-containing protein [Rubrivivax sp.]|nr:DUF1800 domain-containing protein [Rubrivivax sp.]